VVFVEPAQCVLLFVFGCYLQVMKFNAMVGGQALEVSVIRDHRRNLDGNLFVRGPKEKVIEAVPVLRDQDHDPSFCCSIEERPFHLQRSCQPLERRFKTGGRVGCGKVQAHEEPASLFVAVLGRVKNIAAVLE